MRGADARALVDATESGLVPLRLLALALAATLLAAGPARAADDALRAPGEDALRTPADGALRTPADGALRTRLDAALAAPALRGAGVSALVVDRASGAVLYAREPDRPRLPASNLKVLTGVAALARFGPAHRFTTTVRAPAAPDAAGAVDALYVRGGGDPALTSEQWWRLAADLAASGLRRVRGDLVVDGGAFDAERWQPSWAPLTSRAYHAPVGGLAANYGAFQVRVAPGARPGAPVEVALDPPVPYFDLAVEARTGPAGSARQLRVERTAQAAGDRVVVRGTLPLGAEPVSFWRSVSHPARYAGAVLRMQLEANGIAVGGAVRPGAAPEDAPELLAFEGFDLATIVRLFLKNSTNVIAESLVKAMGAAGAAGAGAGTGSWPTGLSALRGTLEGLGVDLEGAVLVDGSGLSRDDRVTARQLVQALRAADASFGFGPEFLAALPLAAEDGTLEKRAGDAAGRVRAKTGLLSGVTGLSGFADGGGREVVFSVLANGYRGADRGAMDALDRFVEVLAAPR